MISFLFISVAALVCLIPVFTTLYLIDSANREFEETVKELSEELEDLDYGT